MIIVNKSKKEAYEIVELVWDDGYIREHDYDRDETNVDYFGLASINYILFNKSQKVVRNMSLGWSWDLETMRSAKVENFNEDIEIFAQSYVSKGFKVIKDL